jgi:hypothetical protein
VTDLPATGDNNGLAGAHRADRLRLPGGGGYDAEHSDAESEMGERSPPCRPRQADRALQAVSDRDAPKADAESRLRERAQHQEHRESDSEERQPSRAGEKRRRDNDRRKRQAECDHQALRGGIEIATLPGEHRPERHGEQQRHHQRREGEIEEGRADRDALAGECFEHERIERADKNGRAGGGQEEIVEDQRSLPGNGREYAARRERARAERE